MDDIWVEVKEIIGQLENNHDKQSNDDETKDSFILFNQFDEISLIMIVNEWTTDLDWMNNAIKLSLETLGENAYMSTYVIPEYDPFKSSHDDKRKSQ